MNLLLYNGGRIKYAKTGLGLQREQAELNMRIAIEDLTEQLMLAYYQVLLVEEQRTVLQEVKSLSKDRLDFQELKREYGSASTFDVIQAKDAYLNDSIAYIQLENQIAGAMGLPPEEDAPLFERRPVPIDRDRLRNPPRSMTRPRGGGG